MMTAFFSLPAQSLKVYRERPPWSMPGVAKNTIGCSDFSELWSNYLTWLKSNMFFLMKVFLIFSLVQFMNSL